MKHTIVNTDLSVYGRQSSVSIFDTLYTMYLQIMSNCGGVTIKYVQHPRKGLQRLYTLDNIKLWL